MKIQYLTTILLFTSCIENPIGREVRYPSGNVNPCEVEASNYSKSTKLLTTVFDSDVPELWKSGPFPTWNTSPSAECENDLVHTTKDGKDVRLYMTYPTRSIPTVSGDSMMAEGKFPVIIFGHANHDGQCSIYQGYYSLHDHWASWGFVVASYDGTEWNCKRGTNENMWGRAELYKTSVTALRELNDDPRSSYYQKLDFSKIILAGHSRGGGAQYMALPDIKNVVGVINLQGVRILGYLDERPTIPTLGITAGRDVDLNYPHVEYMEDGMAGPYTWINLNGGIHAYTADSSPLESDDTPTVTRQEHHDVTEFYTTAFLGRYVGLPNKNVAEFNTIMGSVDILESHAGSRTALKISEKGVFQRWRPLPIQADTIKLIDDFTAVDTSNLLGGYYTGTNILAERVLTYGDSGRHFSYSFLLKTEDEGSVKIDIPTGLTVEKSDKFQLKVKQRDEGKSSDALWISVNGGEFTNAFDYVGPLEIQNRFSQVSIPFENLSTDKKVSSITIKISSGALLVDDIRVVKTNLK